MKRKMLTLILVCMMMPWPTSAPLAAAEEPNQEPDQIVAGHLVTQAGTALGEIDLELYVERIRGPEAGPDTIPLEPIDRATTDATGVFSFAGTLPGPLANYSEGDGTVNLQIMSADDVYDVTYLIAATAPQVPGEAWQWVPNPSLAAAGPIDTTDYTAEEIATDTLQDLTLIRLVALPLPGDSEGGTSEPDAGALANGDTQGQLGIAAYTSCPWGTSARQWRRTDTSDKTFEVIQRLSTRARAQADYEWTTTTKTQMSLVAGVGGGAGAKAGLSASRVEDTSTSVTPHYANFRNTLLRAEFRYFKWYLWCVYANRSERTDKWEWRGHNFTGEHNNLDNSNVFTCNYDYASKIISPLKMAKGSTMTYGAWAEVAGVKIDSQQTNTAAHVLTFTPDNWKDGGWANICGRGNDPTIAVQVKEVL